MDKFSIYKQVKELFLQGFDEEEIKQRCDVSQANLIFKMLKQQAYEENDLKGFLNQRVERSQLIQSLKFVSRSYKIFRNSLTEQELIHYEKYVKDYIKNKNELTFQDIIYLDRLVFSQEFAGWVFQKLESNEIDWKLMKTYGYLSWQVLMHDIHKCDNIHIIWSIVDHWLQKASKENAQRAFELQRQWCQQLQKYINSQKGIFQNEFIVPDYQLEQQDQYDQETSQNLIEQLEYMESKSSITIQHSNSPINCFILLNDSRRIVVGHQSGLVSMFDLEINAFVQDIAIHTSQITSIQLSRDEKVIVSGSVRGQLKVFDNQNIQEFEIRGCINALAISQCNNIILVGTRSTIFIVRRQENTQDLFCIHEKEIVNLHISQNQILFWSVLTDGVVYQHQFQDNNKMIIINDPSIKSAQFNYDDQLFYLKENQKKLIILNLIEQDLGLDPITLSPKPILLNRFPSNNIAIVVYSSRLAEVLTNQLKSKSLIKRFDKAIKDIQIADDERFAIALDQDSNLILVKLQVNLHLINMSHTNKIIIQELSETEPTEYEISIDIPEDYQSAYEDRVKQKPPLNCNANHQQNQEPQRKLPIQQKIPPKRNSASTADRGINTEFQSSGQTYQYIPVSLLTQFQDTVSQKFAEMVQMHKDIMLEVIEKDKRKDDTIQVMVEKLTDLVRENQEIEKVNSQLRALRKN